MICRGWRIAIAVAAMSLAAPGVAAEIPVAPLAPGEILLEVAPNGSAHNRADKVTLHVPVSATAATGAEARRQVAAQADRWSAAARAVGIAADDIKLERPNTDRLGFVGNEAAMGADLGEALPRQKMTAGVLLQIRIRDMARFPALRTALEAAGAANVPEPDFALNDDRLAREQAKEDAMRNGRAEAEAYARSLGLRVVRLARVSERLPPDLNGPAMIQNWMKMLNGSTASDGEVETVVMVAMDFVLAPAR